MKKPTVEPCFEPYKRPQGMIAASLLERSKRCAHRARRLARWAVHHAVDHERGFIAKKTGEASQTQLGDKLKVARDLATRWQSAPFGCDAIDVAAQLNLISEKRIASRAILLTFVWEMSCVGCGKLRGG